MEAKDTVIKTHNPQILPEINQYQIALLHQQAEISFKAGQQNGLSLEMQGDAYCSGLMQGRKEVVEWVERALIVHPDNRKQFIKEWQAKLKEWGIDG